MNVYVLGVLNAIFAVQEEFGLWPMTDSQEAAIVGLLNAVYLLGVWVTKRRKNRGTVLR